jgi:hypothetical protein
MSTSRLFNLRFASACILFCASLFQIPPDYAVTESVAPPLGRRSSSVPASGQP